MPIKDLRVRSPDFHSDGPIPDRFTANHDNHTPTIEISGAPGGTVEFALICHDPDAPRPRGYTHWTVHGIPADTQRVGPDASGFHEGPTDAGEPGWYGPKPRGMEPTATTSGFTHWTLTWRAGRRGRSSWTGTPATSSSKTGWSAPSAPEACSGRRPGGTTAIPAARPGPFPRLGGAIAVQADADQPIPTRPAPAASTAVGPPAAVASDNHRQDLLGETAGRTDVDKASAYIHGHTASVLRSHRTRTAENSAGYLLPELRTGMALLDVGGGPGTITVDLARRVAPGRVTALETSAAVLGLTRAEADQQACDTIDYVVGDVQKLDLPDDSFDVVHAHQVLQHVADPVAALREMMRVARVGGVVAARDGDYAGFVWYPRSPGLDRWRQLYTAVARANGGEPDAGRRLLGWAHAAGCQAVTASSSTWCYADPQSRQEWGHMWADRITGSAVAEQLLTSQQATREELEMVAQAWRNWAADPDGWISVLHGEILIHKVP